MIGYVANRISTAISSLLQGQDLLARAHRRSQMLGLLLAMHSRPRSTDGIVKQYAAVPAKYLCAKRRYFLSHNDEAQPSVERWLRDRRSDARLLDVGCGGGDDLARYRALGFKNLFGIDPSDTM